MQTTATNLQHIICVLQECLMCNILSDLHF